MQRQDFTEKDWKLFQRKIVPWQTAYMDRLNHEYIELLNSDASPDEKFWELQQRITNDKRKAGVLVEMRRSKLVRNICSLVDEGVIGLEDLEEFSDELKENVKLYLEALS